MNKNKTFILILIVMAISLVMTACDDTCQFTTSYQVDLYRVPDPSTEVWGVEAPNYTYYVSARTADGWIGYEPGIAQAPNVGLARLRYFPLNAIVTPSCLESVPEVTVADVLADIAASGGP